MVVLLLTLRFQGEKAGELTAISVGAILVVLLAPVVPMLTESRFILNLHLLRAFAVVQMLLAISLATLAVHWLTVEAVRSRFLLGLGLFAGWLGSSAGLILAAMLLISDLSLGGKSPFSPSFRRQVVKLCAVGLLVFLPLRMGAVWSEAKDEIEAAQQWERIGLWAQQQTPTDAVFYVPERGAAVFSMIAERQLWFVPKYGATVMWSPSYFPIWQERLAKTAGSPSPEHLEKVSAGAIDFVVADCSQLTARHPVHHEGPACVYKLD
jgi:hypothetical protein